MRGTVVRLVLIFCGAIVGAAAMLFARPIGSGSTTFGPDAVFKPGPQPRQLFDCGTNAKGTQLETRCALRVMKSAGATQQAQDFFRETHWFLSRFREFGQVDLGDVFVPWRANANDDYVLLNGSPSVVYVEREAPSVVLFEQDPAYAPLRAEVDRTDDIPNEDDFVLWETDEVFEGAQRSKERTRFVFQWSLNDACHACWTGYEARVGLDFAPDGTYLNAEPLDICWKGGGETERVESSAPRCPPIASS